MQILKIEHSWQSDLMFNILYQLMTPLRMYDPNQPIAIIDELIYNPLDSRFRVGYAGTYDLVQ